MAYITVSIGNTDNKLNQEEWSEFVAKVDRIIKSVGKVHFFGGSPNWTPWQNVAWIFEIDNKFVNIFASHLSDTRKEHKQDSAFFMTGDGMFV